MAFIAVGFAVVNGAQEWKKNMALKRAEGAKMRAQEMERQRRLLEAFAGREGLGDLEKGVSSWEG